MNEFWAEPHIRRSIEDPLVTHWALRRVEAGKKMDLADGARLESSLFDDLSIRRLIDANDQQVLPFMFYTLSMERFHGMTELLLKRWPEWEDSIAGWAAPVIAQMAPDKACDLFDAYIASVSLWEDFNKTAGVSKALQSMPSQIARDLAQRLIEAMAEDTSDRDDTFALTESIGLAWIHDLPVLEHLLMDLVTTPKRARLAESLLHHVYFTLTEAMPFFAHIRDLQRGDTQQSFTSLALLFDTDAPLEELDRLVIGAKEINIGDAFVFVCERCRNRIYRPLDVVRSFMAKRDDAVQHALKPLLGPFFLGVGAASWLRTDDAYAKLSTEDCVRVIAADLEGLPQYEALLARLRECPIDEVVHRVAEALPKVEEHQGAANLVRLMGDLGYEAFLPHLLHCLNEDEDLPIDTAIKALIQFGDVAEQALVESWERLDIAQRPAGLAVLSSVGGEATVDILVRCFPEMRNEWLETWLGAAEAVPHVRLLEVLVPELKRNHPLIDEAFLLLSTLLNHDHEQLAVVRERDAARKARSKDQDLGFGVDAAPESLQLELKCAECGDLNEYEVKRIFVSPEIPEDKPFIADELTCLSCGAFDRLHLSAQGTWSVTSEIVRLFAVQQQGGSFKSPLKLLTTKMWDGRLASVGGAIERYNEAIAKNPRSLSDILGLANCYASVGREKQAEACFRKCVDMDPASPEAVYALADMLENGGNRAEAFRLLDETLKHHKRWRFHRLATASRRDFAEAYADLYDSVAPNNKRAPQALRQVASVETPRRVEKKIGPNAPCPCGSGKKYKKCCARMG